MNSLKMNSLENSLEADQALIDACTNGNLGEVKRLIGEGANVNAVISDETPLRRAIKYCRLDVILYLLNNGANLNESDLDYAFGMTDGRFIDEEEERRTLDVLELLEEKFGQTLLMCACANGDFDKVKYLIQKGAKVNAVISDETPLLVAIKYEKLDVIGYLLDNGANLDESYLEYAYDATREPVTDDEERCRTFCVVILLINTKAFDLNKFEYDLTLLMRTAMCYKQLIISNELIINGADLNIKNKDGMTALMIASKYNNFGLVKLLVQNKAIHDIENKEGKTALQIAKENTAIHDNKIKEYETALQIADKNTAIVITNEIALQIAERNTNLNIIELLKSL